MFVKLNEIHVVDSPFNEDPKNIIFFGKGKARNFDPSC